MSVSMPIVPLQVGSSASIPRTNEPPPKEKRRRTGKPKVRTGCITWIRRIKCDEEKPACQRCVSTGRKCDGYKSTVKPKTNNMRAVMNQQALASNRLVSSQLTLFRPLVTDFAGDHTERHYIHRWLPIAEDVVGIRERGNSIFWGNIVPEYVFTSQSVRHAIVALSAAHHNFQMTGFRTERSDPPSKIECFIIKNYNQAMRMIHKEVEDLAAPPQKRFGVIILACLFFFYTEILLNQWPTAMMHILNGLKLMTNLPSEIDEIYKNPEKWSKGNDDTHTRATYMLRLLCRWEVTAGFLASGNRPSMSLSILTSGRRQSLCSVPKKVASLDHLCEIVDCLYQDVCAFIWLSSNEDNTIPWDHTTRMLQHGILQRRLALVADLLERNRDLYGNLAVVAKASDYLTYQARLLHHRSAALCIDTLVVVTAPAFASPSSPPSDAISSSSPSSSYTLTSSPPSSYTMSSSSPSSQSSASSSSSPPPSWPPQPSPMDGTQRFEEVIALATSIRDTLQLSLGPGVSPWFGVDFGVISALYLAATHCCDPTIRRSLFSLIKDWPWRENLWDGAALRDRLLRGEPIETPPESPEAQLVYRSSRR